MGYQKRLDRSREVPVLGFSQFRVFFSPLISVYIFLAIFVKYGPNYSFTSSTYFIYLSLFVDQEEPAIDIILSKDPIPEDPSSHKVTLASKFSDFVPFASTTEDKSTGRKKLKHTKKRKRDMQLNNPEKKSKLTKKKKSGRIPPEVGESSVPGILSFPSQRLASGFEAVTKTWCETNPGNLATEIN